MDNVLLFTVGSSVPPSSNFLQVSYLSVGVLVSIGVLVLIGEVVAVVLLILNIAMRKERLVIVVKSL